MKIFIILSLSMILLACTNPLEEENSKLKIRNAELLAMNMELETKTTDLTARLENCKENQTIERIGYTKFLQSNERLSSLFVSSDELFPTGTIELSGYSTQYIDTIQESGEERVRNIFVVVEVDELLEDHLINIINSGNSINRLVDGKLAIFYKEPLDPQIKLALESSSVSNPVSLYTFFYSFPPIGFEQGVPEQFEIISVLSE